ncbi:AfsR/SARP family transcriptional regulator [Dictyobacter halimunensis]
MKRQHSTPLPELSITCFGHFEIKRAGQPVTLCPNRNAQAILRYLTAQADYKASAEKLVTVVWPEEELEAVQNKLHIAISALRRSLHAGLSPRTEPGYLVCKHRTYSLNPVATIRTDVGEFLHYYQMGQRASSERVTFYEKACGLYKGPFLPEDLYADWSFPLREQLKHTYLTMCRALATHYLQSRAYEEAATWSTKIIAQDPCDEVAHRQLMQIYTAQGYRSEAIRQYYLCERVLHQELGVQPMKATTQLFHNLLKGEFSA